MDKVEIYYFSGTGNSLYVAKHDPKFEVYEIPTKEDIKDIENKIKNQLDSIGKIIVNKEKSKEKDKDFIDSSFVLEQLVLLGMKYAEYEEFVHPKK